MRAFYLRQERERVTAAETRNAAPIYRLARGFDGRVHLIAMLRSGQVIHEQFKTELEARAAITKLNNEE